MGKEDRQRRFTWEAEDIVVRKPSGKVVDIGRKPADPEAAPEKDKPSKPPK